MRYIPLEQYYIMTDELIVPDTAVACKVVAVTGWSGDWAAYRGPSDWTDEQVAKQGDKITAEAAEGLFPTFRNIGLRYRS